jgi:hypothetical protein
MRLPTSFQKAESQMKGAGNLYGPEYNVLNIFEDTDTSTAYNTLNILSTQAVT